VPPALAPLVGPDFIAAVIGMFEQNNVGIRLASPLPTALLPPLRHALLGSAAASSASVSQQQAFAGRVYLPLLHRVAEDWREAQQQEEEEEEEEEECGEMAIGEGNGGCNGDHARVHHGVTAGAGAAAAGGGGGGIGASAPPATPEEGVALVDACLAEQGPLSVSLSASADGGGLFSALDGTALLSLICCMNHSCAPNADVRWVGGLHGEPVLAEIVALRPVEAGEELYQSYVRVEGTTVEGRREALRDYGFVCCCPRCVEEAGV
jgi:hypothetical protein